MVRTMGLRYNGKQTMIAAYLPSNPPVASDYLFIAVVAGALGITVFCYSFKVGKAKKKRRY